MTTEAETRVIPLDKILDPEFNSRIEVKEDEEFKQLVASMEAKGLISPISVEPSKTIVLPVGKGENAIPQDGFFLLVAGSRRRAAARKLGWTHIKAEVRPESDSLNRTMVNAIENLKRKDLTTYEAARTFAEIRRQATTQEKLTGKKKPLAEIAKELGVSFSTVQWHVQAYETMPEEIRKAWEYGDPVLTAGFLMELNSIKDPGDRVAAYSKRKALVSRLTNGASDKNKGKGSGKTKGKSKSNKLSYSFSIKREKDLRQALDHARRQRVEITYSMVSDIIDWIIGENETVDGLIIGDKVAYDGAKGRDALKSKSKSK